MKTTDLFKINRSGKRLNESMFKTFGRKLNLETFNIEQLEDARNKLRTQIYTARSSSGFNETVENDALAEAQFMHDAIVAELMDRDEHIVDNTVQEGLDFDEQKVKDIFRRFESNMNEIGGYGDVDYPQVMELLRAGDVEGAVDVFSYSWGDKDGGEVRGIDDYLSELQDELEYVVKGAADEGVDERVRDPEDWDEGNTEPANNFAVYINGKKWKVFKGRGQYADDQREQAHYQQLKGWAAKKSAETGKKWEVSITGENPTESIETESAPPTAKGERMVKHIKQGYADDGKLTDKEKGIAYATAWKDHNKNESINTGEDMRNLREGEIQQASAIVTAKTMVDRVGRWIEELSGMENDTLLQLGDSIRDEMGQEQAKGFIEAVAPAIQAALENLKSTREALASGVRTLTGEEQPANMLGGEPAADMSAEPDAMNPDMDVEEPAGDEFAAAEPATGGAEEAGREMRESINRQNRLLKVLAG
jgi:hypothetical protein